ncbi:MAG: ABC transporter permease, partial [Caulobacteraceae bacterium]
MLPNYLLTLYRSMIRHRLYAALNVFGLAVGIAVFLVLALVVRFETSFDRWLPDAANVYRVNSTYAFPGIAPDPMGATSGVVLPLMEAEFPQIAAGTRIMTEAEPVSNGAVADEDPVSWVDPAFFNVLALPLAAGDSRTALASPENVVVSQRMARKYFGAENVIGRTLTIALGGQPRLYRVSGVLKDLPANTHLVIDMLAPLTPAMQADPKNGLAGWGQVAVFTYVRFPNAAAARAVVSGLRSFVDRRAAGASRTQLGEHPDKVLTLDLAPVTGLHFSDAALRWTAKPGVDARLVYALGAVGVLTLLIAILNYMNLATARSALRAKEIAVRKALGATRRALVAQFLAESLVFAFLAALIGLALAELALPRVNSLGGTEIRMPYWGAASVLPWIALLAGLIGLGAGLYPALLLSRFEPAAVLAASRT